MDTYHKKELVFFDVLNDNVRTINKNYSVKRQRYIHVGLKYRGITEWALFYKDHPIMYFDYTLTHFLRRYVRFREICEFNPNVYVIFEDDNWEDDFAMILSTIDLSALDSALLEDFTYEELLDDNILQLSNYNKHKINSKLKKVNANLKRKDTWMKKKGLCEDV